MSDSEGSPDPVTIRLDQISQANEAIEAPKSITYSFTQNNHYSISELPPLHQLDSMSPKVQDYVMETYKKEQEFRHSAILENEKNSARFELDRLAKDNFQKLMGNITGTIVLICCLVWSAILVMNGHSLLGMAPFMVAVGGVILATAWGKKQVDSNPEGKRETDSKDSK